MAKRPAPPTDEIINHLINPPYGEGITDEHGLTYGSAVQLIRNAYGTTRAKAHEWLVDALLAPDQLRLVWVGSDSYRQLQRIGRFDGVVRSRPIHQAPRQLYLSGRGFAANQQNGLKDTHWIISSVQLETMIQAAHTREAGRREADAAERASTEARVEELCGQSLAVLRTILTAAKLSATEAMRVHHHRNDVYNLDIVRVVIELDGDDLVQLADYLRPYLPSPEVAHEGATP